MSRLALPGRLLNVYNPNNDNVIVLGVYIDEQRIEVLLVDRSVNKGVIDINKQLPNKVWVAIYEVVDGKLKLIKEVACTHIPSRIVPESIFIPKGVIFNNN